MNLEKRHSELLRKRYRLPISLLTHQTPPGSVLAEAGFVRGEGRIAGLVSCYDDLRALHNMCISSGIQNLIMHYAEYISLDCLDWCQRFISALGEGSIKVRVVNPLVAREKTRSLEVLEDFLSSLEETIEELEEGTPRNLEELRYRFLDSGTRKRRNLVFGLMSGFLDRVLLLELSPDASPQARAEGMWLLRHHMSDDYNWATADDESSKKRFEILIKDLEMAVIVGDAPIADDLLEARCCLLGACGRYHLESKLAEMLDHASKAMKKYSREVITKDDAVQVLKSQRQVIDNLTKKRSLIGCYFISLEDPSGEQHCTDPGNGNAFGDGSEEEKDDVHEEEEAYIGEYEANVTEEEDAMSCNALHVAHGVDSDNSQTAIAEASNGLMHSPGSSSSSNSSVNSPMTTDKIPQESPISSSSIVSTDSELGNASFVFQQLALTDEEKGKAVVVLT